MGSVGQAELACRTGQRGALSRPIPRAPLRRAGGARHRRRGPLPRPRSRGALSLAWARLTVWGLITGDTSPKQLMGPVAIAQLSGESAQLGWIPLLSLMAAISLNLGLLNLLPIPILDGGHIFIMALEGMARRDFSGRVKEKMLLAGFVGLRMRRVPVI